jgi:hypothetical protein
MALPKPVLIVTRIIVVGLGAFFIGGVILTICDPSGGYSSPPYPTRTQAALSSIWLFVYALFLLMPPSVPSRKRSYLLGAVAVRGLGCALVLFGVAKILLGTTGGTSQVILTLIFTGMVLVTPTILAVVELFFQRRLEQQKQ